MMFMADWTVTVNRYVVVPAALTSKPVESIEEILANLPVYDLEVFI